MQLTSKQLSLPLVTQPQQYAPFVKPVSYEFRVAEYLDDAGKVEKVKLQVMVWEHDEYGTGVVKHYWNDVPRVKMDRNGSIIP